MENPCLTRLQLSVYCGNMHSPWTSSINVLDAGGRNWNARAEQIRINSHRLNKDVVSYSYTVSKWISLANLMMAEMKEWDGKANGRVRNERIDLRMKD